MGKIKELTREKAFEIKEKLKGEAGPRFIAQVMEWENCDWDTAVSMCDRTSDPVRPDYSLGFKLADPMLQMALWAQPGKRARRRAAEDFESTLEPDELELFREQVQTMNAGQMFKSALKKKTKEAEAEKEAQEREAKNDENN